MIALFQKTVNFSELATGFGGKAQLDLHYKHLQRFFRDYELNYAEIAQTVVAWMAFPEPWVLSLDAFGSRAASSHGMAVWRVRLQHPDAGVVHEGVAFPGVWWVLDKYGSSHSTERMDLFHPFLERFGKREIACLTVDREFVGKAWFGYLLSDLATLFCIQIRENHTLSDGQRSCTVKRLFADLPVGQTKVLRRKRRLWGHWLYIAALRLTDDSLLVVETPSAPKSAISDYAKRWSVETLFGIFKTHGFCLESTHLIHAERLSQRVALLTLVLAWAFLTGMWLHQRKPLTIKKHSRRAKNIFRYGFDHLRHILLNAAQKQTEFLQVLQFLSCT